MKNLIKYADLLVDVVFIAIIAFAILIVTLTMIFFIATCRNNDQLKYDFHFNSAVSKTLSLAVPESRCGIFYLYLYADDAKITDKVDFITLNCKYNCVEIKNICDKRVAPGYFAVYSIADNGPYDLTIIFKTNATVDCNITIIFQNYVD